MIQQGERAPTFTLPGIRDGEVEEISLDDHLGADLVVLAFYPGDFNPGCSDSAADLNDLDLFTMQKDLTLFAISGDSVHSHRAFAEQYDIDIPLLSDLQGEVTESYGVAAPEGAGYLTRRAIVVIDHQETVEYTWLADDVADPYDTEALREVIQNVGSDETAVARYRVGHARYIEGRRGFTRAMKAYEDREWMMAQGDFGQASEEFDEARSEFNTAVRFSEDEEALKYFERAETKAEALWRAADWLRESASAFSSGQGAKAESLRSDAEAPLEAARDIHEPPNPDDFPPDEDPAESESDKGAGTERKAYLERDGEEVDTSLDLDEDGVADLGVGSDADAGASVEAGADAGVNADSGANADAAPVAGDDASQGRQAPEGQVTDSVDTPVGSDAGAAADSGSFARGGNGRPGTGTVADEDPGGGPQDSHGGEDAAAGGIDEEEIEEIAAEIEEETEAARERQAEDDGDGLGDLPDLEHGQFGEPPFETDAADADDLNVYGAKAESAGADESDGADAARSPENAGDDSADDADAGDSVDADGSDEAGHAGGDDTGDAGNASGSDSGTASDEEVGETGDRERARDGDNMDLDLDLTDPTEKAEDEE